MVETEATEKGETQTGTDQRMAQPKTNHKTTDQTTEGIEREKNATTAERKDISQENVDQNHKTTITETVPTITQTS